MAGNDNTRDRTALFFVDSYNDFFRAEPPR
jgi:hypothetical protein